MRRDRSRTAIVLAACAAWLAIASPAAAGEPVPTAHTLDRHLPAEPLLAFSVALGGRPADAEALEGALGRLLDDERRDQLAGWISTAEQTLGVDFDEQLLPAIGPQLALSIDFPPIDGMFAIAQIPDAGGLSQLLSGCGAVASIRDRARLDAALAAIGERAGVESTDDGEVRRWEIPLTPGPTLTLHHAVRGDVFAVGPDADWVRRAVAPPEGDAGIGSGADFARVFANLDEAPTSWNYVNLPRLRRWLSESQIVALLVAGDETVASIAEPLLDPVSSAVGVGWTTVERDGGTRTSRFGPPWTSGLALPGGVLAAMVLAETGDGAERAAIRQTLGSIREIAAACEQFSSDIDGYPGPTDGWVEVDRIAMFLEPIYVSELPRTDAWDNPILYWSDGTSYRLISLGRDGRMDRDWSGVQEARPGETPDSDILFADGRFVVLPPQIVNE